MLRPSFIWQGRTFLFGGMTNQDNYREFLECFSKFNSIFERRLYGRLAQFERGSTSGGGGVTGVSSDFQNGII